MGKLREWIDAYAGIGTERRTWLASDPIARRGMHSAVEADRLLVTGRALGLDEAAVEELAEPFLDQFATPWAKIHAALIERAAVGTLAPRQDLMTQDEHKAMAITADLWNLLCRIVGQGRTRSADLGEACNHIHAIQHTILAQAAARAYPDRYRLLGDELTAVEAVQHQ
jgi:hypothetical protein